VEGRKGDDIWGESRVGGSGSRHMRQSGGDQSRVARNDRSPEVE